MGDLCTFGPHCQKVRGSGPQNPAGSPPLKHNLAKFHPDPIWNDATKQLGFFEERQLNNSINKIRSNMGSVPDRKIHTFNSRSEAELRRPVTAAKNVRRSQTSSVRPVSHQTSQGVAKMTQSRWRHGFSSCDRICIFVVVFYDVICTELHQLPLSRCAVTYFLLQRAREMWFYATIIGNFNKESGLYLTLLIIIIRVTLGVL